MKSSTFLIFASVATAVTTTDAFVIPSNPLQVSRHSSAAPPLTIVHARGLASRKYTNTNNNRGGHRGNSDRSKRQERVGTLVQTELSKIIHKGVIRGHNVEYLDDDLRQRISIISADVSPDLKQARISVSVRGPNKKNDNSISNIEVELNDKEEDDDEVEEDDDDDDEDWLEDAYYEDDEDDDDYFMEDANDPAVDSRRAYAWLVRNTKPIRHTLAQRMSHMKSCPDLTFVQVDVAAATDVMYLIDKVAAGYKRERIGAVNENDMPTGVLSGMDFDEDFENEDDWDDDDDDFFADTKSK